MPTPNTGLEIEVNDLNAELVFPANTTTSLGKRIVRQLANRADRAELDTIINFSEDLGGKVAYENLYRSAASNVAQGFSSQLNPVRSKVTLTVNSDLYSPSVDYTFTLNPGSFSTTTSDITINTLSPNNKVADIILSTFDVEKFANLTVCANVYVDGHSVGQKCVNLTLYARALNTALNVQYSPSTNVTANGSVAQTAAVTIAAFSNNTIPNRTYEFEYTKLSMGPDALITTINANTIKISTFNDIPDGNANTASYRVRTILKGGNTPQTVEVLADNTQVVTVSSIYSGIGITSLTVQGGNFQNNQFTNSGTSTAALTVVGVHNATSPACFIDYEFVTTSINPEDVTYTSNVAVSGNSTSNTHRIILTHNPDLGNPFVMRQSVTDVIARLKITSTGQVIGTRTLSGLTLRTGAYGLDFVPVASNSQIGFDAQTASSFTSATWQSGYFEWNVTATSGGSATVSTIQADNTSKQGNVTLQVWANTPGIITQSLHRVRPVMWFDSTRTTQVPLTGQASTGVDVSLYTQYRIPDFSFTTVLGGTTFTGNAAIPLTVANNNFSNSYPANSKFRVVATHNLPFGYVDFEPILTQGDSGDVTIVANTVGAGGGSACTDITLNQTGDYGFKKAIYSVRATLRDNTARSVLVRQIDNITLRTGAYGLQVIPPPNVTKSSAKIPVVAESLGAASFYAGDFNWNTQLGVPDVIYSFYDNIVGTPRTKEVTLRVQTTSGTVSRQVNFAPRLTFPGEPTVVVVTPPPSTTTISASVLSYTFTLTAPGNIVTNNNFQNAAPVSSSLSFTASHNLTGGYLALYAEKQDGDDASFSIANTATQVTTKTGTLTLSVPSGFGLKRAKYRIIAALYDSTDLEVPVATRDIVQSYNDLATLRAGAYGLTFNTTAESNNKVGFTAQTAILAGTASFALPPGDGGSIIYWAPANTIYRTGFPDLVFNNFGSQLDYQLRADSQPAKNLPAPNVNAASYSIGPVLQFDGIIVASPKKTISINATCSAYSFNVTTPSFSNVQLGINTPVIASMTSTATITGVTGGRVSWDIGFNPIQFSNTALTINTYVTAPSFGGSNTVNVSGIEAILTDSSGLIELDRRPVQPYTLDAANPLLSITGQSPQTITGKGVPQATSEIYSVSTVVGTPQMNFPTKLSGSDLRISTGPLPASFIIEAFNSNVGTLLTGTYRLTGVVNYNGQQRQVTRDVTVSANVELSSLDVVNNQVNKVVSNFSSTALEANITFSASSDLAGGLISATVSSLQGTATPIITGSPGANPQVTINLPQSQVGTVTSTYNVLFSLTDGIGTPLRNVSANNNTYGNVSCTILNPAFTLSTTAPTTPVWTFTSGSQTGGKKTPQPISVNATMTQTFTAASAAALANETYTFSTSSSGSAPTGSQSTNQYVLTGTSRWVNTGLANSYNVPTSGTKTSFSGSGAVTSTLLLNGQQLIGAAPQNQNYLLNIGFPPGQVFDVALYAQGVRKYSNSAPDGTSTLISLNNYAPSYSYGTIRSSTGVNYQIKWMGFHNAGNRYAFNASGGTFGLTSATGGAALNGSDGVKWYSSSAHYTEAGSPAGSYQIIPPGCFILSTFVPSNTLGYNTLPLRAAAILVVGTDNKVYQLPAPLAFGWNNDNTSVTLDDFAWAIYPCSTAVAGIAQLVFVDDGLYPSTYLPGYIQTGLALSLQGATLPTASLASAYSHTISAIGGTGPYTWTYSGGALSTIGLSGSASGSSYIVSGTPNNPGTVNFQLTVRDSLGASATASYSVTAAAVLTVGGPPENYAVTYNRSLYTAQVATPYSFIGSLGDIYDQLHAKIRSTTEKTFTATVLSGTVPPGLSWSTTNYALSNTVITSRTEFVGHDVALFNLSGTPTTAGTYTMNMRFSDGSQNVDKVYSVTVVSLGTFPPGSGGGIGCPDPSAMIVMADGVLKRAGDIQVGDNVYTMHHITREYGNYRVSYAQRDIQPRVKIRFSNGQTLICSESHTFYVGKEYSVNDSEWIRASDLRDGMWITDKHYIKQIKSIGMGEVVKLHVDEAHSYIVDGIPSHNALSSDQKN